MLYGLPLVTLVVAAMLGQRLESDVAAAILGFVGLIVGLLISHNVIQRYKHLWQPKILPNCIKTVLDRKSTRLNSSHVRISYAVFCLKKKKTRCTGTAITRPVSTGSLPQSTPCHSARTRHPYCRC